MTKEEYYIDKSKSIRKSVIIYQIKGNVSFPVLYIRKPKYRTEEEFNDILDRMEIYIKQK